MRLTQICFRQHIGRMFKRHWVVQGKKVPVDNGSISELAKLGIFPEDAVEFVSGKKKQQPEITPVQDLSGVPTTARKSNLDCRAEFLIDGLEHAGNLTKTAIIDQLPTEVQRVADSVEIKPTIHDSVRMTILRDQLYEYRPYKCETKPMTLTRLIESCQLMAGGEMAVDNMVTRNTYFSLPIRRAHRTLSFETTLDQVVWRKPSSSKNYNLANPEALQAEVPSIAPLAFDASLFGNAEDIPLNYRVEVEQNSSLEMYSNANDNLDEKEDHTNNQFLISAVNLSKMQIHPQMIVLRSQPKEMKTFHETDATDSQFRSRALMSSFVVAASTAVSCYGANVKRLPKPIVIQSVLNHENRFYFGCFQLNTLDLNDSAEQNSLKNLWFHSPAIEELYWKEPAKERNPVFPHHREIGEGDLFKLAHYNDRVLRNMFAMYSQFCSTPKIVNKD